MKYIYIVALFISVICTEDQDDIYSPQKFVGGFFKFNNLPQGFYEVDIWKDKDRQKSLQNIMAAYSDYDGDSYTDFYTFNVDGTKVQIWLYKWDQDTYNFKAIKMCDFDDWCGNYLENAYPIDINYDGKLDLIMLFQKYDEGKKTGKQLLPQIAESQTGSNSYVQQPKITNQDNLTDLISIRTSDRSQPFLANIFNQDSGNNLKRTMQIVYEPLENQHNGERQVISIDQINQQTKITKQLDFKDLQNGCKTNQASLRQFTVPHFNGMADINGDCMADMVITTEDGDGNIYLEIWIRQSDYKSFCMDQELLLGNKNDTFQFQSLSYADFDFDGHVDFVAIYNDFDGENIQLKYLNNKLDVNPKQLCEKGEWGFQKPSEIEGQAIEKIFIPKLDLNHQENNNVQNVLRYGDINLDGYNDLIIVLQEKESKQALPYIFLNNGKQAQQNNQFTLQINKDDKWSFKPALSKKTDLNFVQVSLFDINENGVYDIFLNYYEISDAQKQIRLTALYNYLRNENNFIKTMGVNGVCNNKKCASGLYYGSTFMLKVQSGNSKYNVAKAVQLSQSAYSPLQLPFSIIGLGRTNSYIEDLTVGYPQTKAPYTHAWETIIPNSQLIIFPHTENPDKWGITIYIQPTKATIVVIIVTACLLLLLGFSIIYCHIKEKEEDKKNQPFPILR